MPADVEMPAPVCVALAQHVCFGLAMSPTSTTIFFAFPSLIYCASASVDRALSVKGRFLGSTMVDSSLPILRTLPAWPLFLFFGRLLSALSLRRGWSSCAFWRNSWRWRPILEFMRI